jgi:2-polyprenyl-3-methyl-5-hydroxy-6-metoxy-1,4-benzoquinol methylase
MKMPELLDDTIKSIFHPIWFLRSSAYRLANKYGRLKQYQDTVEDQKRDRIAPFDDYPPCAICKGTISTEVMITYDGSRIVKCDQCGLWFTNPRISENKWYEHLMTDTVRSIDFTNNRINFGVALSGNIKYVPPYWRNRRARINKEILNAIQPHIMVKERLHDVGCGVGFLMQDAKKHGWKEVSGNELNSYSCNVMKEKFGLQVYNDTLPNLDIPEESFDAVTMTDYIEHTYQPLLDLEKANYILKENGILYIQTFHINCKAFEVNRSNWNMLFWNHVYHFSQETLELLIKKAGFRIIDTQADFNNTLIKVIAKKLSVFDRQL